MRRILAALLLVPFGLACITIPVVLLVLKDDRGMINDTRAYFGAGTAEGVPKVSQVSCAGERSGSSSSRGVGFTEWDCAIDLAATIAPAQGDPWVGRSYEDGMKEYLRQMSASRSEERAPGRIERIIPSNRTGDLPMVRRLSGASEPVSYGLVWGAGEITWRWLAWLAISAMFLGFGAACLIAARVAWRRG